MVYTIKGLSGINRDLDTLLLFVTYQVGKIECPACGEILHREQRLVCKGCNELYPMSKFLLGHACKCGCYNVRYYGAWSKNAPSKNEFQLCPTVNCRYSYPVSPLDCNRVAGLALSEMEEENGDNDR
jgi:hypothetical protein